MRAKKNVSAFDIRSAKRNFAANLKLPLFRIRHTTPLYADSLCRSGMRPGELKRQRTIKPCNLLGFQ